MLGDEGEGDSDASDPVLFTGEASVGGSAAVSAGPSSFSHFAHVIAVTPWRPGTRPLASTFFASCNTALIDMPAS